MKNILSFELFEKYNKPRSGGKKRWSIKYKRKINCNNPKGFSQIQFCKRKKRGGSYKNESIENDVIKQTLNDIFLQVSDQPSWFCWIEGDKLSNLYEIYISFGSENPYREPDFIDDEGWDHTVYDEKEIDNDTIDAILRSIDYMSEYGYNYKIFYCIEYSSDRSEDIIEEISLRTLKELKYIRENEAIRINFRK